MWDCISFIGNGPHVRTTFVGEKFILCGKYIVFFGDGTQKYLTPASQAERWIIKIQKYLYVFILFLITKFGENFEDKIDICFFQNVLGGKVEVKKSDLQLGFLTWPPQ